MLAEVASFYKLGWAELMELPIYTFWELSRNASRLKAADDMRMLSVVGHAFGGKPVELMRELETKRGEIVVAEETFDAEGFNNLISLMGGNRRS